MTASPAASDFFASRLEAESSTGELLHTVFYFNVPIFFLFFFLGFQKEVPTINKNVFFFPHCEMQQTRLLTKTFFFFSSWYFWHMKAQAMGVREGDIMFLCCLFWFTVLNTMRRSTGGEGRKTRSKVTVFNSEGISRQQPQQRRPPAARRFRRS